MKKFYKFVLVFLGLVFLLSIIMKFKNKEFESSPVDESASPEVAYFAGAAAGSKVYLDIISIEPTYQLKEAVNGMPSINAKAKELVCKCYSVNGESAWVHISVEGYIQKFNGSASFDNLLKPAQQFVVLPVKRIHGKVVSSDSISNNLSKKIGNVLIEIGTVEPAAEFAQMEETSYSKYSEVGSPSYIDAISIIPEALNSSLLGSNMYLICKCKNSSTEVRYIYILYDDYKKYIDPNVEVSKIQIAGYTNNNIENIRFSEPTRIHGWTMMTNTVITDDSTEYGEKIFYFKGIDDFTTK